MSHTYKQINVNRKHITYNKTRSRVYSRITGGAISFVSSFFLASFFASAINVITIPYTKQNSFHKMNNTMGKIYGAGMAYNAPYLQVVDSFFRKVDRNVVKSVKNLSLTLPYFMNDYHFNNDNLMLAYKNKKRFKDLFINSDAADVVFKFLLTPNFSSQSQKINLFFLDEYQSFPDYYSKISSKEPNDFSRKEKLKLFLDKNITKMIFLPKKVKKFIFQKQIEQLYTFKQTIIYKKLNYIIPAWNKLQKRYQNDILLRKKSLHLKLSSLKELYLELKKNLVQLPLTNILPNTLDKKDIDQQLSKELDYLRENINNLKLKEEIDPKLEKEEIDPKLEKEEIDLKLKREENFQKLKVKIEEIVSEMNNLISECKILDAKREIPKEVLIPKSKFWTTPWESKNPDTNSIFWKQQQVKAINNRIQIMQKIITKLQNRYSQIYSSMFNVLKLSWGL